LGRSGTWLAVKTKTPGDEPMSQGQTALVVDDDEGFAQIVAAILCVEGFEVRTADNGVHGYSAYFRYPTDWVVTDIRMPELDGLGMMQFIRTVNPRVKTIYMSGEVEKYRTMLDREVAKFAVTVLRKPFTRGNLVEKIIDHAFDLPSSSISPSAGRLPKAVS
jgi:DNA-binding NtrC family response regulator